MVLSSRVQTKHNNGLSYGKGEPLQSKQPKKDILLRQMDDAPGEVELGVLCNNNFNDF
jgi:hypothetical protein